MSEIPIAHFDKDHYMNPHNTPDTTPQTPTPRTDTNAKTLMHLPNVNAENILRWYVDADFARQLERELTTKATPYEVVIKELQRELTAKDAELVEWKQKENSCQIALILAQHSRDNLLRVAGMLVKALNNSKRGNCWCEHGIDNPMCPSCSKSCKAIKQALTEWEKVKPK